MSSRDRPGRFPDPVKLGIAIIENIVEPVLGEKGIAEIKAPHKEKKLKEALKEALKHAEDRFIAEHIDSEVCNAVRDLPIADLPSLKSAVRDFYDRPSSPQLRQLIFEKVTRDYPNLPSERITAAADKYLELLHEEIINVGEEFRSKLHALAAIQTERHTAGTEKNTEQIAELFRELVDKLEPAINRQSQTARRKQWRNLELLKFPVINFSENSHTVFFSNLALGLDQAFSESGYISFNGLISTNAETRVERTIPVYYLWSPQPKLCSVVRRRQGEIINAALQAQQLNPEARSRLKDNLKLKIEKELTDFENEWHLDIKCSLSPEWTPHEFVYDPVTKSISIHAITKLSTDPVDYPEGVRTTSEMLCYLAALLKSPIALIGDIIWYVDNYPLMKLLVEMLDNHNVRWDRIRINVEDYEEWDYINTTFELELKNKRIQK